MKIENNIIVEATEEELYTVYLDRGYDDLMPFTLYLQGCRINGTKIIEEEGEPSIESPSDSTIDIYPFRINGTKIIKEEGEPSIESPSNSTIDIYPLTIVADRYGGVYSGGKYTAWYCDADEVPKDIFQSDVLCDECWTKLYEQSPMPFGVGETIDEAVRNLNEKLVKISSKNS